MAVQQVLEGAAQAVRSAFGEGTEVYAGRVEQGAQQPCVFLEAQEAARRPLPCGRVELTVRVSAVYLAQNAAQGEDAPRLGLEKLLEALAVVQADGGPALRGSGVAGRVEDGTARAEAAYTAAAAEQTDVQMMETLQVALGAPAAERETEE